MCESSRIVKCLRRIDSVWVYWTWMEINLTKQVSNVKAVYQLPFKVTVQNKLRSFQFKLIHNIIPINHSLYKMNIKASPECKRCLVLNETLIHMLCECPDVKIFWKDIQCNDVVEC